MKKMLVTLSLVSISSFAIEFITEEDVAATLQADKVIEVSKYSVASLISEANECFAATLSKSGRAYVVKKGDQTLLVATTSGLSGLTACIEL